MLATRALGQHSAIETICRFFDRFPGPWRCSGRIAASQHRKRLAHDAQGGRGAGASRFRFGGKKEAGGVCRGCGESMEIQSKLACNQIFSTKRRLPMKHTLQAHTLRVWHNRASAAPAASFLPVTRPQFEGFRPDHSAYRSPRHGRRGSNDEFVPSLPGSNTLSRSWPSFKHQIEWCLCCPAEPSEPGCSNHAADAFLAGLRAESCSHFLGQRGRGADHGGRGVVDSTDRVVILLRRVVGERFHDHPGSVGFQRG